MKRADPHSLVGAYVVDAISAEERAEFERHLAHCSDCTAQITGFRETAARLAMAAAATPPASLKARTLSEAAQTAQLPPATSDAFTHVRRRDTSTRRRWAWVTAAVVAVLAGALVVAITISSLWGRLDENQQHNRDIAAVLNAPDATVMKAPISSGGTATVVMSHQKNMLVFTASELAALPPSKGYQLWLLRSSGERSLGMVHPANQGSPAVVAEGLRSGDRIGLCIEPAHGSASPTPPMLVELRL